MSRCINCNVRCNGDLCCTCSNCKCCRHCQRRLPDIIFKTTVTTDVCMVSETFVHGVFLFSRHSPLCLEVVEKPNKCKRVWLPCFWEGQFQLFYGRLLARFTVHRLTKLVELGPYNYTVVCCPIVCRYCSNLLTKYCELLSQCHVIKLRHRHVRYVIVT